MVGTRYSKKLERGEIIDLGGLGYECSLGNKTIIWVMDYFGTKRLAAVIYSLYEEEIYSVRKDANVCF